METPGDPGPTRSGIVVASSGSGRRAATRTRQPCDCGPSVLREFDADQVQLRGGDAPSGALPDGPSVRLARVSARVKTLADTARTIKSMGVEVIVARCSESGGAAKILEATGGPVINAGDGRHEHPTQGLLDALALQERLGSLEGKSILIVGDIANSRVARSNIHGLSALGAQIVLVGPPALVPEAMAELAPGAITIHHDLDDALPQADAVMTLRVQLERGGGEAIGSDYRKAYGLTEDRAARLGADVPVLHPGPSNRGVEIDDAVHDDPQRSLISTQVTCGVAVRMAVLEWVLQQG